jgi:hypothetical protein
VFLSSGNMADNQVSNNAGDGVALAAFVRLV